MSTLRRVNGKLSGINPAVSCCRLRQVQALLSDGGPSSPDGVLCSLGIDSRYNEGCTELARYLFYGLYERQQVSLEHAVEDFPEETLDDVILLIKAECVHLYCNPLNYSFLLPYVSHWRNLHLYCMTEAEYQDEEAAEEFKISSFVTMVQDCDHIGVPYSAQGHVQRFDVFTVEKWPLIQAFALEGIGRGSFFTMKYKLMDMSEKLWQVYNRLDPVSLDRLLAEDLVNFEKQWNGFFSSMELESHQSILELSEAQAGETFRTYYSHGLISSDLTDKSARWQPFVLFGKHSSSADLHNYSFNFPSESHRVRSTGSCGATATHMVVQCVTPRGPLACSRTYFFGTTHTPFLGNRNSEEHNPEVLLLSQIYAATVQGVLSGIRCYSCTTSASKAKDVAENSFLLALDSMGLNRYRSALRSKCEFSIQAVDNQGMSVPLSDESSRCVIKIASLSVQDIPDLQRGGATWGSVVFSESFLESSINILQRDGSVSLDNCYTVLTTSVPRYACWPMESDVQQSEQAQQLSKREDDTCLGTVLTVPDAAYVFSSSQLSSPEEGKIIFFSEGVLFVHAQLGSITLCRRHINSVKFYNPDCGAMASLLVEYDVALLPHLPFPLHSADQCLVFALQPRSRSFRAFYSKVLSVWKRSDSGLNLQTVEQKELSWTQKNMYWRLQKLHSSQEPPAAKRRGSLKTSYSQLPEQDMFLQHFALSSVGQEPILYDHLGALFPPTELKKEEPPGGGDQVVVNVISGLPGSHKDKLLQFLPQLDDSWAVYHPEPGPNGFSASHLHRFLSSFLQRQRGVGGKRRLLLFSPGYADVLEVVQALLFPPDPLLRARLAIGAVTACVEPLASCMEHRFTFPKLLEQCSQGVVSALVFTGMTAEEKQPLVQHIQQMVRSANPTATVVLAQRGAVTRNEDVALILSQTAFGEPQMLQARYVLYPGWCTGRFPCGGGPLSPAQRRLAFGRPVERSLFVARCKAIKPSLSPSPFAGNLYNIWGTLKFSDSELLMKVSYNAVSGALSVTPAPAETPPSCYLTFDGVGLSEDGLKDWLTLSAKQVSRHLEPPPTFLYSRRQFTDGFGEKTTFRPNMEEFIDDYVSDAHRKLERQAPPNLFDL
ncbi:unnamed protein product [Ophioblennius macclurei]